MQITLTNTGKRYNREWIFRHFNYTFTSGKSYAITGANGSGKSTLLQVIAGSMMQSEGNIDYEGLSNEHAYRQMAMAAPYLELIEEMTAMELLQFQSTFKRFSLPFNQVLEAMQLDKAAHKQIRHFSSGMKQRLKLAQVFFSQASIWLLDEPTTNLDQFGIGLYHQMMDTYGKDKLVLIGSNDAQEYTHCKEIVAIESYKTS